MRKWSIALLAAGAGLALAGCEREPAAPDAAVAPPLFRAFVSQSEQKVPLGSFAAFIPCVPELAVVTSPELHVVLHTTVADSNRVLLSAHYQPIGNWDAIGVVTGDVYQPTGVTRQNTTFDPTDGLSYESTFVNNFRWIGPGPGNNLLVHQTIHMTVNANGVVTADVVNTSVECK